MAKNNPFDLPPRVLDSIRLAEHFMPDPATERLFREAASISESHAATLQHFKTTYDSLGWRDTFAAIRSAQHDYVAQFARVRESLDSFARITDESTLARVAQIRTFHDSWLKEATQAQALIGPSLDAFRAHCSDLLGLTEASLARLEMFQLGASFGLERYSHSLDVTMRTLTDSLAAIYGDDIQAFRPLPRFVLERPPQEVFVHVAGVEVITVEEAEEGQAEAETLEGETEGALLPLLDRLGPVYVQKWQGARQALASRNPDRIAHASVSIRELFRLVLHRVAPDDKIRAWSSSKDDFDRGRPTRAARFRFATRSVAHPPFSDFLAKDFSGTQQLITLFDRGVHESNPSLTERQVRLMLLRMDQFLRFLLEIARESDS